MNSRVVLILSRAFADPAQPVFHEYANAGETVCGRLFYITSRSGFGEERMEFVNRRHAEKFARQCKKCARP